MRKLLALAASLLFALSVAAPAHAGTTDSDMVPDAGWTTLSRNIWSSEMNVTVASSRGGGGTQQILRPGTHSARDTDSVYVYWVGQKIPGTNTRCYTYINGSIRSGGGWVDTAWWRKIDIDVRCR